MTGWRQILDSPNGWRCTQCSDFVRTGWIYWERPMLATMHLCHPCVAEITQPKEES